MTMRLSTSEQQSPLSPSPDLPSATMEAGPSTNGCTTNGHSALNGKYKKALVPRVSIPGTRLYDDMSLDREEFVRLVIQSLRDVGYIASADTLEQESGYIMEPPEVAVFRQSIIDGDWPTAEAMLTRLGLTNTDGLMDAKFLINQQKYLELLEAQKTTDALHVLRNQLAPLGVDPEQLHSLSSLIMCSDPADVRQRADWDGVAGKSREQLLLNLHHYIPSSVMIPQRRMPTLLQQARLHQRHQCLYHNLPTNSADFSLYTDHSCDKSAFPRVTTTILEGHKDEVWHIEWSHDGAYLASASKDKVAIIWKIGPETEPATRHWETHQILKDHEYPVGCLAWSLDDSILSTSADHVVKLWDVRTGVCIKTLGGHTDMVTSLTWLPNGRGFLSSGMDRKIIHWDADGNELAHWGTTFVRITGLAVTPDMSRIITVGIGFESEGASYTTTKVSGRRSGELAATPTPGGSAQVDSWLITYHFEPRQLESIVRLELEGEVSSLKIANAQYALINHSPNEIHLWDLNLGRVIRKFTGQKQGHHVIRSCFGGIDGNFVVSGSEDGNVYVWHRETGVLLEILPGHGEGSVNSVAWNPRKERMFASCSDDHTIRIWESLGSDVSTYSPPGSPVGKGKGKIHHL